MKSVKLIILTVLSVMLFCVEPKAQNTEDILRYSFPQLTGSVRALGSAGAWGSAGADISSASINPAGFGLYRKGELTGAISISSFNADATYNGNTISDGRTSFNIPNFGLVFNKVERYKGKDATKGLVASTFAFGLNRSNNFQQNVLIEGKVNNSTRANAFAALANGLDSANFWSADYDNSLPVLAWRLSLIDNNNSPNSYQSIFKALNDNNYTTYQQIARKIRGRTNEYFVSGGINLNNLIYLGASLIINDISYSNETNYRESVDKQTTTNNPVSSFTVNQYFRTQGSGIGGKFGAIIRPVDFLRFGIAYHTPIRHNLTDYYQNTLSVVYNGKTYTEAPNPREDFFEYQLLTPGRFVASGSVIIGSTLIVNADYERVDYTKGRLSSGSYSFSSENALARTSFNNAANNYRVGAEYNYSGIKFRAGYAYYETPLNTTLFRSNTIERTALTGGLGINLNNGVNIDFAVVNWFGNDFYSPYSDGASLTTANIKTNLTLFSLGAGIKF